MLPFTILMIQSEKYLDRILILKMEYRPLNIYIVLPYTKSCEVTRVLSLSAQLHITKMGHQLFHKTQQISGIIFKIT